MTKKFENTPRAQEITRLFQAHEDAVAAYKQADNAGMENSDPAQFYAVQVTMGEAYRALVDFIDTPAQDKPAYQFITREGFEVGIRAEPAFMAALGASQKASDAQHAADAVDMEHTDKAQHTAICDALIAADDHLCEVIEAYAAYMSALAVSRVALLHKPAPPAPAEDAPKLADVFQSIAELDAALRTPVPVKAGTVPDADVQSLYTPESIADDDAFDKLFADAQRAGQAGIEADRAGLEQSDRAQWETLDLEMQRTYRAMLDYLDARIAAAAAAGSPASDMKQPAAPHDVEEARNYEPYMCAVTDLCDAVIGVDKKELHAWQKTGAEIPPTVNAAWQRLDAVADEFVALMIATVNPPASTRNTAPRSLPKLPTLVSIKESDAYEAALMEYAGAVEHYHDVTYIRRGTPEHCLVDAAGARSTACNDALDAVIDAHCAAQVAAVVNALIPAPPRRSRKTPVAA